MTERAGACDLVVISWGCDLVGDAATGVAEDMITGLATAIFTFAITVVGWVWSAIEQTTTPATDAGWLYDWAGRIFGITLPITVGLLVLQVMMVVLRTGGSDGIGRAVVRAGAAVFGTALSLPVIHLATSAVDALAHDLTTITFGDMTSIGDRLRDVFETVALFDEATGGLNFGLLGGGSILGGAVAFIIFGVLLVLGALAVWGALLVRSMLLYVVIVMGPIAIMGLAWDYTRGWFKAWIAVVNALIWTKLAIMIVFGLGVSAIAGASWGSDGPGAVGVLLSGALMMLMAALVPLACYSFMSFVGDEVHASVLHRGGVDAASAGREALTRADPSRVLQRVSRHTTAQADNGLDDDPAAGPTARGRLARPSSDPATSHAPGAPGSTADKDDSRDVAESATGEAAAGESQPRTGWFGSAAADDLPLRRESSTSEVTRPPSEGGSVDARGERAGGMPARERQAALTEPEPAVGEAAPPSRAVDRLRTASSDTTPGDSTGDRGEA